MLVTLIAHTNDPEKTVAAAAKLCYSDAHIETLLDGLTPEKTAAFLQKLSDYRFFGIVTDRQRSIIRSSSSENRVEIIFERSAVSFACIKQVLHLHQ